MSEQMSEVEMSVSDEQDAAFDVCWEKVNERGLAKITDAFKEFLRSNNSSRNSNNNSRSKQYQQ
jgi:hypothetical protein